MSSGEIERVEAAVGAFEPLSGGGDAGVLALLSGGADSVCLLHVLVRLLGSGRVQALHVNHGLRPAAAEDERFCRELCRDLGVQLHVERVRVAEGNVEARAREARYAAAERVRVAAGLDLIAAGHTASDQAETVLYRLVSSPGRRALLAMEPRRGRLVRPLLGVWREETQAYCRAAGLGWREDESNEDRRLARGLLRHEVLPLLRRVNAAADRSIVATAAELRDEAEVLDRVADEALRRTGAGGVPPAVDLSRLGAEPPPVRRLVLRRLAEAAAGAPVPLGPEDARAIERLAARGGSGAVDLGGGLRAIVEYGIVRFGQAAAQQAPPPAVLGVPGRCRFGEWEVVSGPAVRDGGAALGSVDDPVLDAELLGPALTVRAWRDGDRMQPLGLEGTKSLQDLFSDRKVPRSVRRTLPVVEAAGGEIAWVAGVAVSERFRVGPGTRETVRLRARRA